MVGLTLVFTGMDAVRWAVVHGAVGPSSAWLEEAAVLSRALQLLRTFVCAGLFVAASAGGEPRDRQRMAVLFAVMCAADVLILAANQLVAGVGLFLLVQIALAARHLEGVSGAARAHPEGRRWVALLALGCAALWAAIVFGLRAELKAVGLRGVVGVYAAALGASLLGAWSRVLLRNGDSARAWRIAGAMTAFVLCDMSVAAGAAFADTRASPSGRDAHRWSKPCQSGRFTRPPVAGMVSQGGRERWQSWWALAWRRGSVGAPRRTSGCDHGGAGPSPATIRWCGNLGVW